MTDDQIHLMRHESFGQLSTNILRSRNDYLRRKSGIRSGRDDFEELGGIKLNHNVDNSEKTASVAGKKSSSTRLTMSSRVSYFADRIITPEMVRSISVRANCRCA